VIAADAIPLGLYIHLPWCIRKCPYCDFNSHEASEPPFEAYVDALLRDLDAERALTGTRKVATVFIGGGTPSLFPVAAVRRLLDGVRGRVPFEADPEITLEANPGAADAARFAGYLEAGVNRLSIGVQSFNDEQLRRIGRIHDAKAAREALAAAREAGCRRVNVDLMHGLPGSRSGASLDDLRTALAFEPEHLSWYQLTVEPGTAFARRPPDLPEHDLIADETDAGIALLDEAGYDRYEVSAYARTGERARHNLNYWQYGDYIGIGAGAHGKLSEPDGVYRTAKRRSPSAYVSVGGGTMDDRMVRVPEADLVGEFAINALRLRHGYHEELFTGRTGLAQSAMEAPLNAALERGWIARTGGKVRPTALGYRFLNDLQELFLA